MLFDELGEDWPIHDCNASALDTAPGRQLIDLGGIAIARSDLTMAKRLRQCICGTRANDGSDLQEAVDRAPVALPSPESCIIVSGMVLAWPSVVSLKEADDGSRDHAIAILAKDSSGSLIRYHATVEHPVARQVKIRIGDLVQLKLKGMATADGGSTWICSKVAKAPLARGLRRLSLGV